MALHGYAPPVLAAVLVAGLCLRYVGAPVEGDDRYLLVKGGMAVDYSEKKATELLSKPMMTFRINCNDGYEKATAWGCDLTYDYVKINGDYRS